MKIKMQEAILTKDVMDRKKWKGDMKCAFCNEKETIRHLFFECNISKYVWSIIDASVTNMAPCMPFRVILVIE